MPTPDTEALAARLRAVERALTDADADLDPDLHTDTALDQPYDRDSPTEPDSAVERRLCRLEAAVQALRGALDEESSAAPSSLGSEEQDPSSPDRPPRSGTRAGCEHPERPRRATGSGRWPDDLDTE